MNALPWAQPSAGLPGIAWVVRLAVSLCILVCLPIHADALVFEADQRVVARDGVALSVRVWRPDREGRFPVIMQHTPYLSDESQARARRFVEAGFAYVSVDRRGRGMSGGVYRPLEASGPDGADVVAWLAEQDWSDGRVLTRGGSYRGMTQWQLLAEHPPALVAAVPTASVYPGWDFPNPKGMMLAYAARWLAFVEGRASNPGIFGDAAFWHARYLDAWRGDRPFGELARAGGVPGDSFERWLRHPGYDEYWQSINPTPDHYAGMTAPILSITGYFDGDQEGALRYYQQHQRHAAPAAAAAHWLLIGPWDHGGTRTPRPNVQGLVFDEAALLDLDQLHIDWYRHVLDAAPLPDPLRDRVNFYVMGAERWASAPSLAAVSDAEWTLYLDPAGQASDHLYASGRLVENPRQEHAVTAYRHDPAARQLPDDWSSDWEDDRLYVEHRDAFRPDQLLFHSAPLAAPRTLCGQIRFEAYISVNVPDTDVQVRLYEVSAENELRWLGADAIRGRYRHGVDHPQLLNPGEIEPWQFQPFRGARRGLEGGSHLRLVISPLDSPDFDRNDHRGEALPSFSPSNSPVAELRLHHADRYPTRLVLPLRTSATH